MRHVAAPELISSRRHRGTHGGVGAHLYKEV
jgi:hypothetical protein